MSENSREADKEDIRHLIRKGIKTSVIIGMGKWPVDLIKFVKSEELENDKKKEREAVKEDQKKHMAAKRKIHHERFLDSLGVERKQEGEVIPQESNEQNTTVVAPAAEATVSEGFQPSEG